ncbi:MAG: hypothetical protein ABW133_22845, partial [Polyangiaceae bacterium]
MRNVVPVALGHLLALVAVACGGSQAAPPQPAPVASAPIESPLPRPALAGAFPARPLLIPTRRDDVADNYFGHRVADPYRWLENGDSEEVKHWTDEQNAVTRRVLDRVRDRDRLHARLSDLLSIGKVGAPAVRKVAADKVRYFHERREGQQNQPILYVREGVQGKDRVLLDPNQLAKDGTVALDWWFPSRDGKLLAYGLSKDGSEKSTLHVRDVATGKDLDDKIDRTR